MFSDVRSAFVVSKNVLCYTVSKNVNRVVGLMFNQLTESDIKKMEEEIEYRKVVVRKEKLEAVKEARAQGDLSENFEYYAAKKDKNANEKRIRYLDRMVRTAEIIKDESADDEEDTYRIVTTVREDVLNGIISNISPMGKALLGHKVGDRVEVVPGKGDPFHIVIREIVKTTDESRDHIR